MKKKKLVFILISVLVFLYLFISIVVVTVRVKMGKGKSNALEVRTEHVQSGQLIETINAPGESEPRTKVDISAKVSARVVTVDSGMSRFSGVVQSDTNITNTTVSATYTPGAGNIW